jgi:hypothetical protein
MLPFDPSSHEEYLLNICSSRGITILSTLMMFPIIYLQDCSNKKSMLIVIPSSGVSITKLTMDNHFSSAMAAFCDK